MTKTKTKEVKTKEQAVKRLVIGDKVLSASGKILTVSLVVLKSNRTIILFDGDMEVDFDPYFQIKVVQ
jgi:preprotein translocase subunit YajC